MKLLVLDGNSLVNRAFFGIKVLTTKDGRYTNAIYGFQNILLNLLSAHKPDAVAIAWDEKAPTFRHNAYDGYKATRHGMPQELAEQMPALKQLLADLGFAQVSKAGWEADDILGTLAAANEAQGGATLLATGDRDSLQLVDKPPPCAGHQPRNADDGRGCHPRKIRRDPAPADRSQKPDGRQFRQHPRRGGHRRKDGAFACAEIRQPGRRLREHRRQGHQAQAARKPAEPPAGGRDEPHAGHHPKGRPHRDRPRRLRPHRRPDPAAAAQLLADLEMHKLAERWGLDETAAQPETPLAEVEAQPLPLAFDGRYFVAQVSAKDGSGAWYAVQTQPEPAVFCLDDALLPALLDSGAEVWAFDAKPLYRRALAAGGVGRAIRFDGKLAAYLLNPSASKYEVAPLAAEYGVRPAFACAEFADAGVLAPLLETLRQKLDRTGYGNTAR